MATATAGKKLDPRRRPRSGRMMSLAYAATLFGVGWLVLILGVLLWEGFSGLSLQVFTEMTPPPGGAGGLLNPIVGSLVLTVLAVARITGETAPLLFTALNNQFWSTNLNAPMASLPAVIFQFALSPYADWQKLAWTGALIITFTVLALSVVARALTATRKSS